MNDVPHINLGEMPHPKPTKPRFPWPVGILIQTGALAVSVTNVILYTADNNAGWAVAWTIAALIVLGWALPTAITNYQWRIRRWKGQRWVWQAETERMQWREPLAGTQTVRSPEGR